MLLASQLLRVYAHILWTLSSTCTLVIVACVLWDVVHNVLAMLLGSYLEFMVSQMAPSIEL